MSVHSEKKINLIRAILTENGVITDTPENQEAAYSGINVILNVLDKIPASSNVESAKEEYGQQIARTVIGTDKTQLVHPDEIIAGILIEGYMNSESYTGK